MRKKTIALLIISILLLTSSRFNLSAGEPFLYPAVVSTAHGEKWGYINDSGTFSIEPKYDFVREFNQKGIAIVAYGTQEYGLCKVFFINKSAEVISGPFSAYIPEFSNGMAILTTDKNSFVAVDENGEVVLQSNYHLCDYSDGMFSFYDSKTETYGFVDTAGKLAIPADYISVGNFDAGTAIVETHKGAYSVIDRSGRVVKKLKYYDRYNSAEGLTSFCDPQTELYGYKRNDGTISLQPVYGSAQPFSDGCAIVGLSGQKGFKFGLIDRYGRYIMEPEFSGIVYLGQGMYAAAKQEASYFPLAYIPKALFNSNGERLTDYSFYNISLFENGLAVANDSDSTFFIDREGNIAKGLPKLRGIGDIRRMGNLLQIRLDEGLQYLKPGGESVWQKDDSTPLGNGMTVKRLTYRKDYLTLIHYPQISGLQDKAVENKINRQLRGKFLGDYENRKPEFEDFSQDISINFSAAINKNLLIIEKNGYFYPLGAAHGTPYRECFHIDAGTGVFYTLKDLFRSDSKYTQRLTSLVREQLVLNNRCSAVSGNPGYFTTDVEVLADQDFILGSDAIKIYYHPYEIASYVFGFPEFEIPYGKLSDIISSGGALWNSFDKVIVQHKVKVNGAIEKGTVKALEQLLTSYETGLMDAIDKNSFKIVEPSLLEGSSLYNSQKSLIWDLHKKDTREKLINYEIYSIERDYISGMYRIFVNEEIAVRYSGKSFVNKKYSWCYTAVPQDDGSLKLSSLEKW